MAESKISFHTFLSHRHSDQEPVSKIFDWLQTIAGFNVWYDQTNLVAGQQIASQLPKEIEKCQSIIVTISKASVESGWVEQEYNFAINFQTRQKGFKIIPLRIDDTEVPGFLSNYKWMDVPAGNLSATNAENPIDALNYGSTDLNFSAQRDVYLSRSWRSTDAQVADVVTKGLIQNNGYRFIGDSEDQVSFTGKKGLSRVELIINSCGALIAILPDRGNGETSPYVLKEIEFARKASIPVIVIKEEPTGFSKQENEEVINVKPAALSEKQYADNLLNDVFDNLKERYKVISDPLFVFWASNFDDIEMNKTVQRIIEKTTAMPCLRGDEIREEEIQKFIVKKISDAFLVLADISGDNLNTCIECGIARGSNTRLFLLSGDERKSPPFMFRDLQVNNYKSGGELIGKIYKLIRPFRRRVFNYEL